MPTFADWVMLPENRLAREAVGRAADALVSNAARRPFNPLFLSGSPGTGKSHLGSALIDHVAQHAPDRIIALRSASDLGRHDEEAAAQWSEIRRADLIVVEDLQHLPAHAVEAMVQLLDRALARQQQLLLTAHCGPALLVDLPIRLTSRFAQGLTVALLPWSAQGRRIFLQQKAQSCGLTIESSALDWLGDHLPGSGRALEGALTRMEVLARLQQRTPTLADVLELFRAEADAGRPTLERIVRQVGAYFRIKPDQLQTRRRGREVMLPRQVGMYLARRLTDLSLQQVGAWFGGRDHSTVLHACRKVEQALGQDAALSGAVRQLLADLG
jgi:chromosomal replication initiator protein